MGLREVAENDLGVIMEDSVTGWGWTISLTSPQNLVYPDFTGFSTDIGQAIDPQTGLMVSGRTASVSLRISKLYLAGITTLPHGVAKPSEKPWQVFFNDIHGQPHVFKVVESLPDRALGVLVLLLETYKP